MTCVSLLSRYKNGRFLPHIVTGDEKWVLYRNVKCRRTVGRVSEPPPSTSKPELHSKKVTSVGWDIKGIIRWEVLEPNQTFNVTFYCQQLNRLRVLRLKRPDLVNRQRVIIHHDNARPHAAITTVKNRWILVGGLYPTLPIFLTWPLQTITCFALSLRKSLMVCKNYHRTSSLTKIFRNFIGVGLGDE